MKREILAAMLLLCVTAASAWDDPCEEGETYLYTDMQVDGSYDAVADDIDVGDSFTVGIFYGNHGGYTAGEVELKLENVPADWVVLSGPPDLKWDIGTMTPWSNGWQTVLIQKGPTNAVIFANITGCNSEPSLSNKISIPIYVGLVVLLLGAMVGLYYWKQKKD